MFIGLYQEPQALPEIRHSTLRATMTGSVAKLPKLQLPKVGFPGFRVWGLGLRGV